MSNLLQLGGKILEIITGYTPLSEIEDCPESDDQSTRSIKDSDYNISRKRSKVKSIDVDDNTARNSIKIKVDSVNTMKRKQINKAGKTNTKKKYSSVKNNNSKNKRYEIPIIEVESNLWNCKDNKNAKSPKMESRRRLPHKQSRKNPRKRSMSNGNKDTKTNSTAIKKLRQNRNNKSANNIFLTDEQCKANPVWLSEPIANTCIVNTCPNAISVTCFEEENDVQTNSCELTKRSHATMKQVCNPYKIDPHHLTIEQSPVNLVSDHIKILSSCKKDCTLSCTKSLNNMPQPVAITASPEHQIFTIVGSQQGNKKKIIYANISADHIKRNKEPTSSVKNKKPKTESHSKSKKNDGPPSSTGKNRVSRKAQKVEEEQPTLSGVVPDLSRTISFMDEVMPNPMVLYNRMMSFMEVDNVRTNSLEENNADKKKRIIDEVLKDERHMSHSRVIPQNAVRQKHLDNTVTPSDTNYIPFDLYSKNAHKKKIKVKKAEVMQDPRQIAADKGALCVRDMLDKMRDNEDEVGSIRLTTSYSG